jgi:chromosome segregation ATPase
MILSPVFIGSVALLAGGGGSFAVTRSHYQRRIRGLEARLRELRGALRAREAELGAALTELSRIQERLISRERRLDELGRSIRGLREVTVDLGRRLDEHEKFSKRMAALLSLRLSEHRHEGEAMRERLVHAEDSLAEFSGEETALQAEVVELDSSLRTRQRAVETVVNEHQRCATEVAEHEKSLSDMVRS